MARTWDLFPYETPRRGQAEFLRDARETLTDGGILLAQAPTGLGKTAVAITSAVEHVLHGGGEALFTTCRRSQHRIAVETLRAMASKAEIAAVDITARDAMCPGCSHRCEGRGRVEAVARTLLRRPLHVQEAAHLARRFGTCPHAVSLRAAADAHVVVCDYNYLFSPQRAAMLRALRVDLEELTVVVDEAHNLPSRARRALSASLTSRALRLMASSSANRSLSDQLVSLARSLEETSRYIGGDSRLTRSFLDRVLRTSASGKHRSSGQRMATVLRDSMDDFPFHLRAEAEEAVRVLEEWDREDRLRLLSRRDGGCLSLVALDPRPVTQEVFRKVDAALLMSGTLHPGSMYVDLMGIPRERSKVRSYLPDFPPENRLLLVSPYLSSAYKQRDDSLDGFARAIVELCHAVPGNLAAFFPSYRMATRVGRLVARQGPPKLILREMRGQTKSQKEDLLRVLEARRWSGGCLLLAVQGGSLSEGVDYPGNLLHAVIIAGLALEPPQLEVEALRSFYARRYGRRHGYEYAYLYPALNRMVQCAGRCIRSREDVAAVVILDRRLLKGFYRSRLPGDFRPEGCRDLQERVRSFFYERQVVTDSADKVGSRGRAEADEVDGQEGGGEGPPVQGVPPPPA